MPSDSSEVILHNYWRSSSSYRVRIALNFHGISYTYKAVNLLKSEQLTEEHKKLNPSGLIPVLQIDGTVLAESIAILEYLEETRGRKLLPENAVDRATARRIAHHVEANIQPIQNFKVLKKISEQFGEQHKIPWAKYVNETGLESLEELLKQSAGKYAVKDQVTIADLCIVPQVYNAIRFEVDMSKFPTVHRVYKACLELDEFKKADPSLMPDAQK